MNQVQNSKQYDLGDRTTDFAKNCRDFINELPITMPNKEYGKQLLRSSGSVAANYIEANESLSKRDFIHRIKICRKEAKESRLWLQLCEVKDAENLGSDRIILINESMELVKIFSSIVNNSNVG